MIVRRIEWIKCRESGELLKEIKNLFKVILNIPATSTEAEHAFSASGLFITKMHSRLCDKSVHSLSFLIYYNKSKPISL